jgi:hypothetical protein
MIVCLLMVMVKDDCLYNHLSPLTSINKQSSLTITINKQTIISHHYHQQTNNHLSEMIVFLLMAMVRDDCFFVDGDGEGIVC